MDWMDQPLGHYILITTPYPLSQMYANPMPPSQIASESNFLPPQQQFNHVNNSYGSYNMPHLFLKPMWLNWDFLDDDEPLKKW